MSEWERMLATAGELTTPEDAVIETSEIFSDLRRVVLNVGVSGHSGHLSWQVRGDAVVLDGVQSDDGADALLAAVTEVRPMDWWRVRALLALTIGVATTQPEGSAATPQPRSEVATTPKGRKTWTRHSLTDDAHLREVARIYRGAPSAPTQAVADTLHVSHSTASRWARAAAHKGFLNRDERGDRREEQEQER